MLTSNDIREMNAKSEDGAKIFILTCTSGTIDGYADSLHKKGFDVDLITILGPHTIWYDGISLNRRSEAIIRLGSLNEFIQLINVIDLDFKSEVVLSSWDIPQIEIYNDYRE